MPFEALQGLENRQSVRRTVSWRARLLNSNGQVFDCRAIDSSPEGLALICSIPVRDGEHVQVALQKPNEQTGAAELVTHRAVVVASVLTPRGFRVGLAVQDNHPAFSHEVAAAY